MENQNFFLIDTDFTIELLSGNESAHLFVNENKAIPYISVISIAELMRGAQNKVHLNQILKDLDFFTSISLDEEISFVFMKLMSQYTLSHQIGISDALIAATAITYDLPLLTCNSKHFRYIAGLELPNHNVKPIKKSGFWGF